MKWDEAFEKFLDTLRLDDEDDDDDGDFEKVEVIYFQPVQEESFARMLLEKALGLSCSKVRK